MFCAGFGSLARLVTKYRRAGCIAGCSGGFQCRNFSERSSSGLGLPSPIGLGRSSLSRLRPVPCSTMPGTWSASVTSTRPGEGLLYRAYFEEAAGGSFLFFLFSFHESINLVMSDGGLCGVFRWTTIGSRGAAFC